MEIARVKDNPEVTQPCFVLWTGNTVCPLQKALAMGKASRNHAGCQ